jgi:hypothetical protein
MRLFLTLSVPDEVISETNFCIYVFNTPKQKKTEQ